ncbi:MAG: hypothetical protein FWC28_03880 [Proteobacteria bacterium]|nr:hypothetical protein [Cystobacterineae bacterium]MCL2258757.1 hypothetical protein [Cystobacterineae bacterium]MCL2314376.1 hypothetical protein [Pseudomonadota bacterium]
MSRIDDDHDAVRQAERIAEQKRMEERHREGRKVADSAFARLVSDGQKQQGQAQRQSIHRGYVSEADAKFLERADSVSAERVKEDGGRILGGRWGTRSADRKPHVVLREWVARSPEEAESAKGFLEGKGISKELLKEQGERQAVLENQEQVKRQAEQATKLQRSDRAVSKQEFREQAEAGKKSALQTEGQLGARSAQAKTDTKKQAEAMAEARNAHAEEKGLHRRQTLDGKRLGKEAHEGLGTLLSTNPAFMEPAPIVRPKLTSDSERLRRIASEIAQKIVERVRVGTNKAGDAEFQIDLRSDVLSGLSLKVSASGGKISVVFSGSNKNALKSIEEQSEALRNALDVRGLTLADMKLEMIS